MGVLWSERDSRELGEMVARMIVERTQAGIGADGKRLKRKADGSPSTLTDSGTLLRSLRVTPGPEGAVITATAPYAAYVDEDRPFMGLTDKQLNDLDKLVERRLDRNEREFDRRSRR